MASVYDIAVKLNVSSNHKEILGSFISALGNTGAAVDKLLTKMGGLKGVMGTVGAGIFLDAEVKAAGALIKHGDTVLHQQSLMAQAGMSQQEIARATAQAWKTTSEVMGSNVEDNLQNLRELRGVFGDQLDVPMAHLSQLVRAHQVIGSLLPHANADDDVFQMAKALEMKGVSMDPAHFDRLLDEMVKASIAMGGKINGGDFLSAMKFGRTAALGWDDKFMGSILPTLMQEFKSAGLGGSGAMGPGNALMSAYRAVVSGHMNDAAAQEFARLGLIDHSQQGVVGSARHGEKGAIVGSSLFSRDPYAWVQQELIPALTAKGITTPEAIQKEISQLFELRTASQIMGMFATQQQRFEKDAQIIGAAQGVDAAKKTSDTSDPTQVMKNFTSAWDNLLTALGGPLAKDAMEVMKALVTPFTALAKAVADNPALAKGLTEVGVALAALSTVTLIAGALKFAGAMTELAQAARIAAAADVGAGLTGTATGLRAVAGVSGLTTLGGALSAVAGGLSAIGLAVGVHSMVEGLGHWADQLATGRTDEQQAAKDKALEDLHQKGWEQFKGWFLGAPATAAPPPALPGGGAQGVPPGVQGPQRHSAVTAPPSVTFSNPDAEQLRKELALATAQHTADWHVGGALFPETKLSSDFLKGASDIRGGESYHIPGGSQSITPPPKPEPQKVSMTVTLDGTVPIQMDGRTVAMLIAKQLAAHATLPQGGTSAVDLTMGAISSGQQVRS
jgi:hypothetical protein